MQQEMTEFAYCSKIWYLSVPPHASDNEICRLCLSDMNNILHTRDKRMSLRLNLQKVNTPNQNNGICNLAAQCPCTLTLESWNHSRSRRSRRTVTEALPLSFPALSFPAEPGPPQREVQPPRGAANNGGHGIKKFRLGILELIFLTFRLTGSTMSMEAGGGGGGPDGRPLAFPTKRIHISDAITSESSKEDRKKGPERGEST
jgi:hypothetical protein